VGVLRAAIPFVQRILPLLDGNIGTAVSNILTPHQHMPPPHPPVNLEPIEDDVAALQEQHRDLRNRILEQHASLKRVEDQLEKVREAADRNTFEQQELVDDLKAVRKKVNRFALLALVVLAVSLLLNVALCLHILHILP
jgi:septal ring factor EnvC (AmiA/AmiB activator)